MIRSMTAFGRAVRVDDARTVTVELRSVNSRFFDCTVRLPRAYTFLEEKIKAYVQQHALSRGKMEVSVSVARTGGSDMRVALDQDLARGYVAALRTLRDTCQLQDDISVMRVAERGELFTFVQPEEDPGDVWETVCAALGEAVAGYRAMREAEGRRTEEDICAKLENIRRCATEVAALSREDVGGYRARLEARLRPLLGEVGVVPDEGRLLTECAIFADKIAVDEELARLDSHFTAFRALCQSEEPAGRKLDFLVQEMNRETNTIGSKACNARIAHLVVDMKGELEKIREQVQNIE